MFALVWFIGTIVFWVLGTIVVRVANQRDWFTKAGFVADEALGFVALVGSAWPVFIPICFMGLGGLCVWLFMVWAVNYPQPEPAAPPPAPKTSAYRD